MLELIEELDTVVVIASLSLVVAEMLKKLLTDIKDSVLLVVSFV